MTLPALTLTSIAPTPLHHLVLFAIGDRAALRRFHILDPEFYLAAAIRDWRSVTAVTGAQPEPERTFGC